MQVQVLDTKPFEMFWATGALSSFHRQYTDISGFPYYSGCHALYYRCRNHTGSGAGQDAYGNFVWRCIYGSNTYIGNAPNFMVKSLSDENGINMPSFFGYIWWSLRYLIPVFIIDMIIFFL